MEKELLKELKEALEDWKRYEKEVNREDFLRNRDKRKMVMHNMLIAIQSAIDLANEIIVRKKLEAPTSYKEVFIILGNNNIIEKKLANELEKLASFRNVVVHLYWKIDYERCYDTFIKKRKFLEQFFHSAIKLVK
jgi:uncharacterized protein YutE (UPF0331/DUF86 family)